MIFNFVLGPPSPGGSRGEGGPGGGFGGFGGFARLSREKLRGSAKNTFNFGLLIFN